MNPPILSSSFSLENGTLWFGKICLQEDKITISGWGWSGPVEESIAIEEIQLVERWTTRDGPNFRFRRKAERPVFGRIEEGAAFWEKRLKMDDRIELKNRH